MRMCISIRAGSCCSAWPTDSNHVPPTAAVMNLGMTEVEGGGAHGVSRACRANAILIRLARCIAAGKRPFPTRHWIVAYAARWTMAKPTAQLEFKVNQTRPTTPKTGEVVWEGRVIHKGRPLAMSEVTLKENAGKLFPFGTETSVRRQDSLTAQRLVRHQFLVLPDGLRRRARRQLFQWFEVQPRRRRRTASHLERSGQGSRRRRARPHAGLRQGRLFHSNDK